MAEPIEANYVPEGDDWTITVSGRGKKLTARAPGIIAARDRTDQLVEQLAPDEEYRTVVHLLNGDAVQFTTAYLTARMTTKAEVPAPDAEAPAAEVPSAVPAPAEPEEQSEPAEPAKADEKPKKKAPSPRPREADKPATSPSSS